MIAPAPPAVVAPAPIRFAPPIGRLLTYQVIDHQPSDKGATTVTQIQTLRFDRAPGGVVATHVPVCSTIEAPPRVKAALEALQAPREGVAVTIALAADGTPGAVMEPERSWAPVAASYAALERKAAEPGMATPAEFALLRALIAGQMPHTPAERDARLREGPALLLAPPLPALLPDETRDFTTTIAAPGAALPARGTTTLVTAAPERLVYRIAVASDRTAGAASAASLRARLAAITPAAERSRIEAMASALESSAFSERIEVEVDPRTGLLLRLHSRSFAGDGGSDPRLIAERTITLQL